MIDLAVKVKDLPRAPVAMESSKSIQTGSWRTFKPVIEKSKCSKCYSCWKFCPDVAIEIIDDFPEIRYDFCKGCGICANECPKKCIKMIRQELE